jgi:flagellar hook-associated protein 1 FlgK
MVSSSSLSEIALRGIQVAQVQTQAIVENIQNVDNPDYKHKAVILESSNGVSVKGFKVNIDRFLSSEQKTAASKTGYLEILNDNLQRITSFFGDPTTKNNIIGKLSQTFSSLEILANEPYLSINKNDAVDKLQKLTSQISSTSSSLYQLSHEVDQAIAFAIQEINSNIQAIDELKKILDATPKNTEKHNNARVEMERNLAALAENIGIKAGYDESGKFFIRTKTSISLADDLSYKLIYNPLKSIENIIKGESFLPIEIAIRKGDSEQVSPKKIILSPKMIGIEQDFDSIGGRLGGLLEIRDKIVPENIHRLDSLAVTLKENFNKLHNLGSGFPPAGELRANRSISREASVNFNGKMVVSALHNRSTIDNTGHTTSLLDSNGIPSLELNFDNLDTGNGAGQANIEGILQEINYNFNERITSSTAALSGLDDVRLVSLSNTITPGGPLNLTLEVDNFSNRDIELQITGVTALDASNNSLSPSFTSPSTAFSTGLGSQRQGNITLTNPLINDYPYSVVVNYTVVDQGVSKNYAVTYKIDDPNNNVQPYNNLTNGILNARFSARAAIDSSNNSNVLKAGISDKGLLEATLVDAKGNLIPSSDKKTAGYIKLTSKVDNWHVGLADLDSVFRGDLTLIQGEAPTFMQHFGLNDLFVRTDDPSNWNDNRNTALFFDLRNDIKTFKTPLAVGKLTQVSQSTIPQATYDYNYEVGKGDGCLALEMARLKDYNLSFFRADYQTTVSFSLREYTTNLVATPAAAAQNVLENYEIAQGQYEELASRISSQEGVNLNDEVLRLMELQNKHAALMQAISVSNQMMQTLLNIFN